MADQVPTLQALQKLRVVDLRQKLSAVGLTTGGKKDDLIQRYHKHLVEVAAQSEAAEEPESESDTENEEEPEEAVAAPHPVGPPIPVGQPIPAAGMAIPPIEEQSHPVPVGPPQPVIQMESPKHSGPEEVPESMGSPPHAQPMVPPPQFIQQSQPAPPVAAQGQTQPPPAQGLTDDEKFKLGAQQAAMIQMQTDVQNEMREAQIEALARTQHMMLEQEKQRKEDEDLQRLQQIALIERTKEEQMIQMQQQQQILQEQQRQQQQQQQQQQQLVPPAPQPPPQMVAQPVGLMPGNIQGPPPPQGIPMAVPNVPPPGLQQAAPQHTMQPVEHHQQPIAQSGMAPVISQGGPPMGIQHTGLPPIISQGGQAPMIAPVGPPPPVVTHVGQPQPMLQQSGPPPPPGVQSGPMPGQVQPINAPASTPQIGVPMNTPPPPLQQINMMVPPPNQQQQGPPQPKPLMQQQPEATFTQAPPTMTTQGRKTPPPLMSVETQPPVSIMDKPSDDDEQEQREIKLPQALEKVLAYKGMRVQQVGVKPEEMEKIEKGEFFDDDEEMQVQPERQEEIPLTEDYGAPEEEEEEDEAEKEKEKAEQLGKKETKNKKRKKKKKRAKQRKLVEQNQPKQVTPQEEEEDVEVEYVQEELELDFSDPAYSQFAKIFKAFRISEPEKPFQAEKDEKKDDKKKEETPRAKDMVESDSDVDEEEVVKPDEDKPKLSKKKMKKMNRLSVAELKQLVTRPDVVEMHDVTARDPKLLVNLKATRNTVPVPRHWCFKRKYLQGKRGIEKAPFDLPEYIKNTGIMEMRQALQEKEDAKTMKSKMRERVRPKMGKIDIDYQKLHDAFFRHQSKPKMSIHGELYYEGKEFETRLKEKKPGNLSDELRTALGMPIGAHADKFPPPWLIAMQRYGPPPSYPNLKIPGLNAPIPDNCSFGYHAGGWGKPPVDENGKPLYGDVFGTQGGDTTIPIAEEEIDRTRWGELESESESEKESSSEEEEDEELDATGLVTPGDTGLVTPSGLTSVPIGVETPDMIELRKKRIEDTMDQGGDTPALYTVLPEKKQTVGGAMMGSSHVYDMAAIAGKRLAPGEGSAEGIEVALNPEELDLDTDLMQAKYEQTVKENQSQLEKEDLSDMVAEHTAKQKKRKKQQQEGKAAKKYKEFKF